MKDVLVPLALLRAVDEPISGRTRLQKYAFLLQKETGVDAYDFAAGDYGPFSRRLYSDVDDLVDRGWIDVIEEETDEGLYWYYYDAGDAPALEQLVDDDRADAEDLRETAAAIREELGGLSIPELLDEIYAAYPAVAKNSVYQHARSPGTLAHANSVKPTRGSERC